MLFNVALPCPYQAQPPHSIKAFDEASPKVKELYLESTKTAGLLFTDRYGYLVIGAAPQLKRTECGPIIDVCVNLSNTKFLPDTLLAMVLKHSVGVAPSAQVPSTALTTKS